MRMLIILFLFFAFIIQAAEKKDIIGTWLTAEKDGKISIYEKNGKYHGKIVWLKKKKSNNGGPLVDDQNPDISKRDRPLLGLVILKNFEYEGDLEWEDGEIYDPKSGKTYDCNMELSDDGKTLKVRGYIGFSLIGRTEEWTKAD